MILFRYICREVYLSLLIITLVLVSVLIINEFSRFLLDVAAGKYGIATAFLFVGLQLPLIITYLLPLALFLGILLSIGRLYADHEMTVMSACGMSLLRQTVTIMSLVFVVALFSGWLSLWVNPRANLAIQDIKQQLLNNFKLGILVPNQFDYFDDTHIIYVEGVSHLKNTVQGVFLAAKGKTISEATAPVWDVVRANDAYQVKRSDVSGRFIVIHNGIRYHGVAGSDGITSSKFDRYGVNVNSPVVFGASAHVSAEQSNEKYIIPLLPTSKLYAMVRHDPLADAEWQLRMAIPISVIISSLIAISLSAIDPRRGRYFNLLPALLLYLTYSCIIFLSDSWIKNGVIPFRLGMWWIHGTMLIIALILFGYRIGWQRIRQLVGLA